MTDVAQILTTKLADRYPIERELGQGGMALVYVAHDLRYDRRVAVKVLRPEIAASVGAERFLREIEIGARLQHPHILPLLDSGGAGSLLYYVMPYVEGETLRDRLRREIQLPIPDVLRIAGQVADALDYAHSRGLIHRDVKPENILLAGDNAFIADFGIARAAQVAGGEWQDVSGTNVWRTETGIAIGTLGYMSPEQAMAAPMIDGRSDQYGLACVVYEMLAGQGETPFPGQTLQIVVARMLSQPAPSVRVVRESVPGLMDEALQRALAKAPADRFRRCADFVAALERRPTFWDKAVDVAGTGTAKRVAAAVAGVVALIVIADRFNGDPAALAADTTNYVIFPFHYEAGTEERPGEAQRLHDAFGRWTGLTIENALRLEEALGGDGAPRAQGRAAAVARRLGAGRYVRVAVSPLGVDSLRVTATLYDVSARGPPLRSHTVGLPASMAGAGVAFATLADRLLFEETAPEGTPGNTTTRSLPAAQSFARGEGALETWDLAAADSGFMEAARADPEYTQAYFWAAVVRLWNGSELTRWHFPAEQAALGRDRLPETDRPIIDALIAQAREDLNLACGLWREVTEREPNRYAGWVGWARCQLNDSAVVADPGSPSGWRFRSSYHRMLLAYERAFELHPAIFGTYQTPTTSNSLQALLFTRGNAWRVGRAVSPDTMTFRADPSWQGDTLAFVPYPQQALTSRQYTTMTAALDEAVRQQRLRFRRFAEIWAAAFPTNAGALEALATSLAMLGNAAAIDTLQRARRMARSPDEQLRLAGVETWMYVVFGLPFHRDRLGRARFLADSLLRSQPPGATADPRMLAGLAALTGRANLAATYMRQPAVGDALHVPPPLRPTAQSLLMYAALGGPADSLIALERAFLRELPSLTSDNERNMALDGWFARAATLAFAAYPFAALQELRDRDNYLLQFQLRWVDRDTASLRRDLRAQHDRRKPMSPELLTIDGLYPEAELWAALEDGRTAAEWLDPTLAVLSRKPPSELADPVRAAALMRALVLRARIDRRLGNQAGAAAWANAVTTLWDDADAFLQPTVRELRKLSM